MQHQHLVSNGSIEKHDSADLEIASDTLSFRLRSSDDLRETESNHTIASAKYDDVPIIIIQFEI